MQVKRLEPLQEGIAGPAGQEGDLLLVEADPDPVLLRRVLIPPLIDGPVGPRARRRGQRGDVHCHGPQYAPDRRKLHAFARLRYARPPRKEGPP